MQKAFSLRYRQAGRQPLLQHCTVQRTLFVLAYMPLSTYAQDSIQHQRHSAPLPVATSSQSLLEKLLSQQSRWLPVLFQPWSKGSCQGGSTPGMHSILADSGLLGNPCDNSISSSRSGWVAGPVSAVLPVAILWYCCDWQFYDSHAKGGVVCFFAATVL